MNEYMKEVKRLAQAYADAKLVRYGMNSTDPLSADPEQAFSELIAHIQRGAAPEHSKQDVRCGCCGYMTYHREHTGCIRAAEKTVPAQEEVQMPEPDVTTLYSYTDSTGEPRNLAHTLDQMRAYGAACRAAGEAAGYIKGVKEENNRCRQILIEKMKHYDLSPDRAIAAQCFDHAQSLLGGCAYDAALRGEVKP